MHVCIFFKRKIVPIFVNLTAMRLTLISQTYKCIFHQCDRTYDNIYCMRLNIYRLLARKLKPKHSQATISDFVLCLFNRFNSWIIHRFINSTRSAWSTENIICDQKKALKTCFLRTQSIYGIYLFISYT